MKKGFTLIELLVVVLIIGILATLAIPYYKKTVETSKATNALSLINTIANANKMYRLDNNSYTSGQITDSCNTATCNKTGGNVTNPCNLVACGYLAKQQWSQYQWRFCACNGTNCAPCPGCSCAGTSPTACGCNAGTTSGSPYNTWGYTISDTGACTEYGTKTPPCVKL